VILCQCGRANKDKFTRHGAWFAAKGIAVMIMDNIEMGEIEFTITAFIPTRGSTGIAGGFLR